MITRMLGRDAEVDFSDETKDIVRRLEERFPCPEYAVVFQEAEVAGDVGEEHDESREQAAEGIEDDTEDVPDDILVLSRRHSGVLVEMAWMSLEEIAELDAENPGWLDELAADLGKTQAELDAEAEEG